MASKKTMVGTAATSQHGGREAAAKGLVSCMDCVHALLHRYGDNPVLAACMKKPNVMNERFPYQVEVARCKRHCIHHQTEAKVKVIEQRRKVA